MAEKKADPGPAANIVQPPTNTGYNEAAMRRLAESFPDPPSPKVKARRLPQVDPTIKPAAKRRNKKSPRGR